ncbi:MAG: type II toxin-antitoxin system HicB family antitoxin [Candidatus Dormibacteraeota bacterium]|nr:type II toxin-antitoxin system HicB family antitoxin [Candidatus Dormibacteraeota bacterium]
MAADVSGTAYVAEVERDEAGNWIASVPALRGVHTHARTLAGLRRYLQDAIALWLEVDRIDAGERDPHIDRDTIEVELRLRLPAAVRRAAETARRSRERAQGAEQAAAIATREAARALVGSGLSRRDAAEVLRLSHQRVDQLLRSA